MENFGVSFLLTIGLGLLTISNFNSNSHVEASSKMKSMGQQQILAFAICTSWGYRNAVGQYAQLVRQHFPEDELKIEVRNYPVDKTRQNIANLFTMLKMAFIAVVLLNYDPTPLMGLASPPGILTWAWENKGYACMMAFFLGNAIENGLISTGAFEIYLSEDQLWSKIDTGRIPSHHEFLQMLNQATRLQSGHFHDEFNDYN